MEKKQKLNVAVIDYEMSNLFSVAHACNSVGLNPIITNNSKIIKESDAVILPGVGSFQKAMQNLEKLKLIDTIIDIIINNEKPFMGICLGFQLLFSESEEFGICKGLDVIEGKIEKIPKLFKGTKLKVPIIGWNKVFFNNDENPILNGIQNGEYMYFVHSYYAKLKNNDICLTKTSYYNFEYCSSVSFGKVFAFQFHPEKSGKKGLLIYRNFKKIIEKEYQER